ncbi:MAG TPA: hypothetical protein VK801_17865 [Caulobacteraceae bacterium]|nr:hypothetical protein [Caulobacteraceae bacterium]
METSTVLDSAWWGATPGRRRDPGAARGRRVASDTGVSVPDPLDSAFEQEARLVSLEAGQLAASIVCVVAIVVAIASGATSLALGRAIDRNRNREIAYTLMDMRDWLARMSAQPIAASLPPPPALGSATPQAALPAPAQRMIARSTAASEQEPIESTAVGRTVGDPVVLPPTATMALNTTTQAAARPGTAAMRVITPDSRDRMVRILGLSPDSVVLTSDGSDEAEAFADQLAGVFRDAGWKVERSLFISMKRPLAPLSADLLRQPRDQAVIAAFAAAGFNLPARDPGVQPQAREIFIGRAGARG